jgi:hypothetical protein
MRLRSRLLLVCCLSLAPLACREQPAGPADGGAPVGASADAGDQVTEVPDVVTFTLTEQLPDAGVQGIAIGGSERALIEPTQSLELRTDLGLRNHRVRLFDEAGRAMVSDDEAADSNVAFVYRMSFPEPLKTGHKYTLVVDAQTGATMTDAAGRPVADQRFELLVAGEKEKPAPPPRKPGRRRR